MIDIDSWFPNFEMFVLFILPAIILVTIAVFIVSWWVRRPKREEKAPMDWMEIMKFGTALYLIIPIYRVVDYVRGNVGSGDLIRGLFVTDFTNFMLLALLTGIMGLIFILRKKIDFWKVKS